MKQEFVKPWTDALRSGKYKQTTGVLQRNERSTRGAGFCCLGVLCDVLKDHENVKGEWVENQTRYEFRYDRNQQSTSAGLPRPVLELTGIKQSLGRIDNKNFLAYLNDDGKTFDEIADIIDANWEKL